MSAIPFLIQINAYTFDIYLVTSIKLVWKQFCNKKKSPVYLKARGREHLIKIINLHFNFKGEVNKSKNILSSNIAYLGTMIAMFNSELEAKI